MGNESVVVDNTKVSELENVERIFQLQTENRWNIANTNSKHRIDKLKKFHASILSHQDDLRSAMYKDFKKSSHEVDLTEIMPVISEIKDACHHLRSWMEPKTVPTPLSLFPSSSEIIYEPKGVVLIIGPWNYPFQLIGSPLVAAIAAGNCAILKPSNNTKYTSEVIKKIIEENFPENEIAVFTGERHISNALLEKPFDHIFFTGSPAVGKTIMQAASKHLTSVTLELGGKSPVIVDETVNLNDSIPNIIWGKILNAGQTCVGVDYALVHESKFDEFIEKSKKQIEEFYGRNQTSWETNPDFCRIINDKSFERLKHTLEESISRGAKVEIGGKLNAADRYISPTILSNVSLDLPVMNEELFGPILPVLSYRNIEDAIQIIQRKEKPLALYIFSEREDRIQKILKNTSSGGVVINGVVAHLSNSNLPFGGVNHSGMGSYHGYFGFKAFSHERAVLKLSKLSPIKILFPPYGNHTKSFVELMTKYL